MSFLLQPQGFTADLGSVFQMNNFTLNGGLQDMGLGGIIQSGPGYNAPQFGTWAGGATTKFTFTATGWFLITANFQFTAVATATVLCGINFTGGSGLMFVGNGVILLETPGSPLINPIALVAGSIYQFEHTTLLHSYNLAVNSSVTTQVEGQNLASAGYLGLSIAKVLTP